MQSAKEALFSALTFKNTEQIPWVPFAGVHAGSLCGYRPTEVLTDADKLYQSLLEVNRLYQPFGQPVVFDLQLEAEILGCELLWSEDGPPSVASHPLEDNMTVPCRCTLPTAEDGRLPVVLDVMKRMKAQVGENTALFGLVSGPFTLASHLRGNDIFIDMYDNDEYVKELLSFCTDVAKRMTQLYIDAGMDVIAVVDPLVSQISVDHFEEFLNAPFCDIFKYVKEQGKTSAFFVCGDATRNIEAMCKTKPNAVFVDENVNIIEAKKITDQYHVAIGGNIPLTSVMLHGTQQDNMKYTVDLIDSIGDTKGLILAPGCDMPYSVPIDNTIAVAQAVLHTDEVREMLKNYVADEDDLDVKLPDYQKLERPLIEVFTLDSLTCAACTYMMGAANAIKEEYGDRIDLVEYKFTKKENIARCKKMGVQHLPSIYINGELKFSSIIPSRNELRDLIDTVLES